MKHADGRTHAKKAAKALCNLNTYYAVIALMEGGLIHDGRHQTASRIVKLCKTQAAKELAIYDEAMGKIRS